MGALPWVRCTLQKDSDLPGGGVALELSSTDVGMDVTSYKIFRQCCWACVCNGFVGTALETLATDNGLAAEGYLGHDRVSVLVPDSQGHPKETRVIFAGVYLRL